MLTHHCVRVRVTSVCSVYEEEQITSVWSSPIRSDRAQFFSRTSSISIGTSCPELRWERTTINTRQGKVLLTVAYTKRNVIIKRYLLHRDVFVLQSRKKRKLTMKIKTLSFRFLPLSLSLYFSFFSLFNRMKIKLDLQPYIHTHTHTY